MTHTPRRHRWHLAWPGNYCLCCGAEDPVEDALACRACVLDPEAGTHTLCAEHQRLLAVPCPCPCEHAAHTPEETPAASRELDDA